MRLESREPCPASNETSESFAGDRFSSVKNGLRSDWAVRLRRTALFASSNEAHKWSSPIPVTILPQVSDRVAHWLLRLILPQEMARSSSRLVKPVLPDAVFQGLSQIFVVNVLLTTTVEIPLPM